MRRDALDEAMKPIYDEVATPSATSVAGLQGPGGIMLHSPSLVAAHRAYNRALRTVPDLPQALKELAILVAARAMDQAFEWTTHEGPARAAGLDRGSSTWCAIAARWTGCPSARRRSSASAARRSTSAVSPPAPTPTRSACSADARSSASRR